jgi:phosphoribosylanthranilate isomerase
MPSPRKYMKVKVCGITSYEDAVMTLDQGVDALGFNFFPSSSRYIKPEDARAIIRRLPPFVSTIGLFVNVDNPSSAATAASVAGVSAIQLHGNEAPDYCRKLSDWRLIKALRIGAIPLPGEFDNLDEYPVQAFLLDSKDDVLFGGTGKAFHWERAKELIRIRPIILAGGLRPDNVREAIRIVEPYAVDVCSGVERSPGKKDVSKLREFMNEVKNVC